MISTSSSLLNRLATIFIRSDTAGISFFLAWVILFGPVYLGFAQSAWLRPENAHAPFLLAICIGLSYAEISSGRIVPNPTRRSIGTGLVCITLGLMVYAFARIQEIELVLSAMQPVIGLGAILLFLGRAGLDRLWFVLVLSLYLVTWPGWMIDMLTFPLKILVSEIVASVLYVFGLPIAHEGAIISVGAYSLLVADACAGLNSLIALTSIGVAYLYIIRRGTMWSNGFTIAMLVPIGIFANLVRVAILVLITHTFGYDAGQSFLHELSGIVMFAAALICVFLVEAVAFALVGKGASS